MCQIQLVKNIMKNRKGNLPVLATEDYYAFANMLDSGSISNRDAYGIYDGKKTIREFTAFHSITTDKKKKIFSSIRRRKPTFLLGHNRFATSGKTAEDSNNHPFETEDLIMVHNGVLVNDDEVKVNNSLEYEGETDSLVIIHLLQKYITQGKTMIEAIQRLTKKITGTYSVFVYDKRTDELYYFKNRTTSFYFRLVDKGKHYVLLGSTGKSNIEQYYENAFIFSKEKYPYFDLEPSEEIIYKITNDNIEEVGEFKICYYTNTNTYEKKNSVLPQKTIDYQKQAEQGFQDLQETTGEDIQVTTEELDDNETFDAEEIDECLKTFLGQIDTYWSLGQDTIKKKSISYKNNICTLLATNRWLTDSDSIEYSYRFCSIYEDYKNSVYVEIDLELLVQHYRNETLKYNV